MDEEISEPPTRSSFTSAKWFLPVATGVAGLLLGSVLGVGIVSAVHSAAESQAADTADAAAKAAADDQQARAAVFSDAVEKCDAATSQAEVSDGGMTMTINNVGKKDGGYGLDATTMWCVIDALGAPSSATSHMEQTTSMDGRQTESWDDIEVSWSYHPDRGMDSVWKIAE